MTRGGGENPNSLSPEVPSALYTISKNVLGPDATDTIAPFVREALPVVIDKEKEKNEHNVSKKEVKIADNKNDTVDNNDDPRVCTTPEGPEG